MSFTMVVKDEASKIETTRLEDISELSAIIRIAGNINNNINVTIENNAVARRVFKLFKEIYGISPSITVRNKKLGRGLTYILNINNKVKEILEDLSIIDNNKYLSIPKEYLISDEEQLRAYLRGVFLVSGSVNDPKTSRYHMEFILDTKEYANFINKLLNSYDLNSKIIKREKNYTVYIKEAEKISDFLRVIKAFSAVMYFEDIRIYRDHKNMTNRLNNCEQANMDKVFMTANKQINDIEKLYELDMVDLLDEKLKTVIEYRMKYKESSLKELESKKSEQETKIAQLNEEQAKVSSVIEANEQKLIAYSVSIIENSNTISELQESISTLTYLIPTLNSSTVIEAANNSISQGNLKVEKINAEEKAKAEAAIPSRGESMTVTFTPGASSGSTALSTLTMQSTAYTGGTLTATGTKPVYNPGGISTIAVDPSVIPLGSKVYVSGYGIAIAADTGGAINGNIIDLYFNSEADCIAWGRRNVTVEILALPGQW